MLIPSRPQCGPCIDRLALLCFAQVSSCAVPSHFVSHSYSCRLASGLRLHHPAEAAPNQRFPVAGAVSRRWAVSIVDCDVGLDREFAQRLACRIAHACNARSCEIEVTVLKYPGTYGAGRLDQLTVAICTCPCFGHRAAKCIDTSNRYWRDIRCSLLTHCIVLREAIKPWPTAKSNTSHTKEYTFSMVQDRAAVSEPPPHLGRVRFPRLWKSSCEQLLLLGNDDSIQIRQSERRTKNERPARVRGDGKGAGDEHEHNVPWIARQRERSRRDKRGSGLRVMRRAACRR
eukprot:2327333-Rhodomonas_salina.2